MFLFLAFVLLVFWFRPVCFWWAVLAFWFGFWRLVGLGVGYWFVFLLSFRLICLNDLSCCLFFGECIHWFLVFMFLGGYLVG